MDIQTPPFAFFTAGINKHTIPSDFSGYIEELQELLNIYQSATKEISTKLEILNDEFQTRHKRNPIHSIKCRVKAPVSIVEKLNRKGYAVSIASARENLADIAGIRVVCSYIDDIYTIAGLLTSQDDITLVRQTDYIKHPKKNGYRSLHLVVEVPVFFSDRTQPVKAEIQIRTIAMDFWASLDHELRYKAESPISSDMAERLRQCAEVIAKTDAEMQEIHRMLQKMD